MAQVSYGPDLQVKKSKFNDGSDTTLPALINGCWTLAGGHGGEVYNTFGDAFAAHAEGGLTAFDTADIYGKSESILGDLQLQWAESGKKPVQIFTKYVPNIFQARPTKASVTSSIKNSLNTLKMSKVDLVQMHWWDYAIPGLVDAGLWLTDLKEAGLIGSVGVTNLNTQALAQLVDAGVPVVCNQVQFSLLDRRPLQSMVAYCQARGIKLLTYGSLAGGLLSDRYYQEAPKKGLFGVKYDPIDLNTSSLKMYWNVVTRFGGQELWRELLSVLWGIGQSHSCSIANVALAWVRQQGAGDLVHPIVGLRTSGNLAENVAALAVHLDERDMEKIRVVLDKSKGPTGDCYSFERGE